ncbi:Trehalose utilization [Symmachiella dynata]|uniref:ThuA domain-containing protein n=1 Tax=Symmachiella dynata TaxID=2527995 RepID=UPI00118906D7|nr:ThuA domain-containing protein [Symmachiella dynata]QDT49661.1 Trehalose utilization [Symmachiella dynata]
MFNRREMLAATAAAASTYGLGSFPAGWADDKTGKRRKVLMYTRSEGYQHASVSRDKAEYGPAELVLMDLGQKHGFDVYATKDGSIFTPENIAKYDAFFFYTQGDLSKAQSRDESPPVSAEGKAAFLQAIKDGKGFVATHSASDTYHSPEHYGKNQFVNQPNRDPYIEMIGGEFIKHGPQQVAKMVIADPKFPGLEDRSKSFEIRDEWYSLKNFADDLHVVLIQETAGMKGSDYDRPNFPATWARKHGKGRVFYSSMGHRADVWTNPIFQNLILGALSWATGNVNADITPNLRQVTPEFATMPPAPAKKS